MINERLVCTILTLCIFLQNLADGNAENITHANTTRLCRNNCKMSSISFKQLFSLPSNCGSISSFYGCRVEIDVNYTRQTYTVSFSAYKEDDFDMFLVDYDYLVDEALYLTFYRNLFTNTVIFTCLTDDYCADSYVSIVVQQLIDSELILYELLPLYLINSIDNRTITCMNGTVDEMPCYGGFCESITQETVTWSHHTCDYPGELSVLTSVELTSLTTFFLKYEPENPITEHINDNKMTLICNVDLCNSQETRNRGKLILDRYNLAAFDFIRNDTTNTTTKTTTTMTTETLSTTTTTPSIYSSTSQEISTSTATATRSSLSSTTIFSTTQSSPDETSITSNCHQPDISDNDLQPWHIALIVIGVVVVVLFPVLGYLAYKKCK
ncbi:hypothetical protein I4U23_019919 [Adineta vaga]|nr:hypothetical protein I4U23_019919 [Adineta vaga]